MHSLPGTLAGRSPGEPFSEQLHITPAQLPARGHPWVLSRSLASLLPPVTLTLAGPKPGPPPSPAPLVKTHSTHRMLLTLLIPHPDHTWSHAVKDVVMRLCLPTGLTKNRRLDKIDCEVENQAPGLCWWSV